MNLDQNTLTGFSVIGSFIMLFAYLLWVIGEKVNKTAVFQNFLHRAKAVLPTKATSYPSPAVQPVAPLARTVISPAEKKIIIDELFLGAVPDLTGNFMIYPNGAKVMLHDELAAKTARSLARIVADKFGSATPKEKSEAITEAAINKILRSKPQSQAANGTATGIPLIADMFGTWQHFKPGKDGHLLICGTTGSGKGNLITTLCLTALTYGPSEIELVVVDAKGGVDYQFCNDVQHATLFHGDAILDGLLSTQAEMNKRIELLKGVRARNLHEFRCRTGSGLPWLLVVCDEFADLNKEQKLVVESLARMGRAAGVVLLVCTQYPTAEVLSSQIQANILNRMVLGLAGEKYCEVALGKSLKDCQYNPALITGEHSGIGVYKTLGTETIGRGRYLSHQDCDKLVDRLADQWPKEEVVSALVSNTSINLKSQNTAENWQNEVFLADTSANTSTNTTFDTSKNGLDTSPDTGLIPAITDEKLLEEAIRIFLQVGWSANKIFRLVGGNRNERLAQVAAVKKELDNE
ncbi:MAG: FtsK/SpoIIIE domain-containing protein [Chloroflexota bacterium]